MLYINNDKIKKQIDYNNLFVAFDYDRTITSHDSVTSWEILEESQKLDKNYIIDSKKLYDYYRKIEIDSSIDTIEKERLMDQWMNEQISLLMKYGVNEQNFNELLNLTNKMKFRNGLEDFFKQMNLLGIPVIVISAGLGNVVIKSLKENNCLLDNVTVISNILSFNNNLIEINGFKINSINKSRVFIPNGFSKQIENKSSLILFGDQISDLLIMQNFNVPNKISVGFLSSDTKNSLEEYRRHFDIVATENEDYNELRKILIKK